MITSTKINSVQAKIKAAIAQIAREENVDITFGSCRYDSAKYNTTMTVKTKVITVNDNTSKMLGFDGNVIGRFTIVNGKTFTITDIKTRNRTYPIIAEFEGRSYKLSVPQVKRGLLNLTK